MFFNGFSHQIIWCCFLLIKDKNLQIWFRGPSINDECRPMFEIFDPSLHPFINFTKESYGVMSPLSRSPSLLSGWRHLWTVPNEEFQQKLIGTAVQLSTLLIHENRLEINFSLSKFEVSIVLLFFADYVKEIHTYIQVISYGPFNFLKQFSTTTILLWGY